MASTKTAYFTQQQNQLATIAKALGHPARIAILEVLLKNKSCVCNEIVTELPLAQATISQHLKVLKAAGLIKGEIAPNKSCYCIDPQGWEQARALLEHFFGAFDTKGLDLCCE